MGDGCGPEYGSRTRSRDDVGEPMEAGGAAALPGIASGKFLLR